MKNERLRLLAGLAVVAVAMTDPGALAQAEDKSAGEDAGAPAREKLEGPKLDAVLADITRSRKELKTLRAHFTQERRITLLATSVKSTGDLTCVTPDRLRWDLAPPDAVVYFVGPEGLSYKTKSSTATVPSNGANVARALGDLRALLTGDLGSLRERYVLEGSRGAGGDVEIKGTAKDAKDARDTRNDIRAFALVLDKGLVLPVRARLYEGKTDSIDLAFSNVVVNAPVDPAQLRP
jgi:outer membrane lipoprotein-sorting protein